MGRIPYKYIKITSVSDFEFIFSEIDKYTHIDCSGCSITEIPERLFDAVNLSILDLSNNQISKISHLVGRLINLEYLALNNNKLDDLPIEFGALSKLRNLFFIGNEFEYFSDAFKTLNNLEHLYLTKNKITFIPDWINKLTNLKTLFISDNPLERLSIQLGSLKELHFFYFDNTVLEYPSKEISSKGNKHVLEYLKILAKSKHVEKIYEAKLLIVGGARRGKTSLMKRLTTPSDSMNLFDANEISTEGIEVKEWYLETSISNKFKVNIWDFGGQEIYHSTHQFFLTDRSLYVFVWDATNDDNFVDFDYWLNTISLLGKSSPILIVQNKIDQRTGNLDEKSLKTKFPNIAAFHKISIAKNKGIEELLSSISSILSNDLKHVGDSWATEWLTIREKLKKLKEPVIEYTEYLNICKSENVEESEAEILSRYFHDLGTFLHFNSNPILNKYLFLNPGWITDAVYKVIDNDLVINRFGKFFDKELTKIWGEYKAPEHILILELMKKFELMFQLPNEAYIIPKLLKPETPDYEWDSESNLRFEYKYDFMPDGILSRFIVRVSDLIYKNIYWRFGLVIEKSKVIKKVGASIDEEDNFGLEMDDNSHDDSSEKVIIKTRASIIANYAERKICVCIQGDDKKSLLNIITRELDSINQSLNFPGLEELVACNCIKCKTSKKPYFHSYNMLLRYKYNNKSTIPCGNSMIESNVLEIIGEYPFKEKPSMEISNINIVGGTNIFADNIQK